MDQQRIQAEEQAVATSHRIDQVGFDRAVDALVGVWEFDPENPYAQVRAVLDALGFAVPDSVHDAVQG